MLQTLTIPWWKKCNMTNPEHHKFHEFLRAKPLSPVSLVAKSPFEGALGKIFSPQNEPTNGNNPVYWRWSQGPVWSNDSLGRRNCKDKSDVAHRSALARCGSCFWLLHATPVTFHMAEPERRSNSLGQTIWLYWQKEQEDKGEDTDHFKRKRRIQETALAIAAMAAMAWKQLR